MRKSFGLIHRLTHDSHFFRLFTTVLHRVLYAILFFNLNFLWNFLCHVFLELKCFSDGIGNDQKLRNFDKF